MTYRTMTLLSGATLALAACGSHNSTNNTAFDNSLMGENNLAAENNMAGESNMAAANMVAPSPTTAQGFANTAAASDHFEIESSKLAAGSAKSPAVKSFADKMIKAHTESTAKLKGILAKMSPAMTADDTLPPEQQQTLDSLKGKTGADFDSAYAAAQVDAHQKTLDALKAYAASGDNAQLKGFANEMIPIVTAHLNLAKGLK